MFWQITYHLVNTLVKLAWRKYDLLRLRQLESLISSALFFPLCLSAAPRLRDLLFLTPPPVFGPKSCFWDLKWSGWWKLCDIFPLPWVTGCYGGVICKLGWGVPLLEALLWCQLWAKIRVTAKWQWELASEAVASCVPSRTVKAWWSSACNPATTVVLQKCLEALRGAVAIKNSRFWFSLQT